MPFPELTPQSELSRSERTIAQAAHRGFAIPLPWFEAAAFIVMILVVAGAK
ncbi:MAG: hypothetical protein WCC57_04755 [Paracoccaceae bacterium]